MKHYLAEILENKFTKTEEIRVFRAPARINIIGEHVDYLGGLVLPAAIDFEVRIAIQKNKSNTYNFYSVQYDSLFSTKEIVYDKKILWVNYILGVIEELKKYNLPDTGFDLVIDGNIPQGSGLSSSAALEVVVGFALNSIFNLGINLEQIALIGQAAENNFVGTKCGIMDQFIIANGKKDQCLLLNTATLEKTYHSLDLKNFEFYLINSNVKHSLNDSEYNTRREECEFALKKIQAYKPSLKNLYDLEKLESHWNLGEKESIRVQHVIGERHRTQAILEYFRNHELKKAASILYAAHDSLSKLFEVSCSEIDFLIDELKTLGIAGARMIGGGFGGCILVLDEIGRRENSMEILKESYFAKFSLKAEIYSFQISEGVTEII